MTTTLISGANRGLGFEVARQLVAAGHQVWIGARDEARGEQAADTLAQPCGLLPSEHNWSMSDDDLIAEFDEFRWWTLWEFHSDLPLREPYLDAPNYFKDISEDERARMSGRLLRELHREGWATFVHRDKSGNELPLSDAEVEDAIALMPHWPVAREIEDVWLLQTEKARVWQWNEHRERFGAT